MSQRVMTSEEIHAVAVTILDSEFLNGPCIMCDRSVSKHSAEEIKTCTKKLRGGAGVEKGDDGK